MARSTYAQRSYSNFAEIRYANGSPTIGFAETGYVTGSLTIGSFKSKVPDIYASNFKQQQILCI